MKHLSYTPADAVLPRALCGDLDAGDFAGKPKLVSCPGCRAIATVLLGRDPRVPRGTTEGAD
jgi:hypothetical protein